MKKEKGQSFENFEGLMPIQKTLRFRLIPDPRTSVFLEKREIVERDRERKENYLVLKQLADDYYRHYIQSRWTGLRFDWIPLYEMVIELMTSGPENRKKSSESLDAALELRRKQLLQRLEGSVDEYGLELEKERIKANKDEYSSLFKAALVVNTLPDFLTTRSLPEVQKKQAVTALAVYSKFTSQLTGFWETRKNIFTDKAIATSITNRAVNENFFEFVRNRNAYFASKAYLSLGLQRLQIALHNSSLLAEEESLDDLFNINNYNQYLVQSGIERINTFIGGFVTPDGEKIQGWNELINLHQQTTHNEESPNDSQSHSLRKMTKLKKQILADSTSISFRDYQVEDDRDLLDRLNNFHSMIVGNSSSESSPIQILSKLGGWLLQSKPEEIWVDVKHLNKLSHMATGNWSRLRDGLYQMSTLDPYRSDHRYLEYVKATDNERDYSKLRRKIFFNFEELQQAIELSRNDEDVQRDNNIASIFTGDCFTECEIEDQYGRIRELAENDTQLLGNSQSIEIIKNYLDAALANFKRWEILQCKEMETRSELFYPEYENVMSELSNIIPLYNLSRNYLSRKPDRKKQFKLNFDIPNLANGWSESKIKDNLCTLLRKDGYYYLGILSRGTHYKKLENHIDPSISDNAVYERLIYHFFPSCYQSIPKCSVSLKAVREHFQNNMADIVIDGSSNSSFVNPFSISYDIFKLHHHTVNDAKLYQIKYLDKSKDLQGYREALAQWIDFCISFLNNYKGTAQFDYSHLRHPSEYENINQFYADVDRASYRISFQNISANIIEEMVDKGELLLFKLFTKDFSPHSTGRPNLHTLYWRALFSEENIAKHRIKLNGEAELFFRPAQIESPERHKRGSYLLNRFDSIGNPIPDELYKEIFGYLNQGTKKSDLSEEAINGLESELFVYWRAHYDLIKDRRYTKDQMFFHVPISFNWDAPSSRINDLVNDYVKKHTGLHIIGIDRGERHLLYYSVLNEQGELIEQASFNTLKKTSPDEPDHSIEYHRMLALREKERAQARLDWQSIDRIKDLKEGYLSNVVHELTKLIIKYNGIVVLENLNVGFKRGRFKVERQVYQKFEVALTNKLSLLVFKDKSGTELGSCLRPWQLARPLPTIEEAGRQNGIVYYVPAAYTSITDPTTGFINLFSKSKINPDNLGHFFGKFKSIRFDHVKDRFEFTFNYRDLSEFCRVDRLPDRCWTVISGERTVYRKEKKGNVLIDTTSDLKKLLSDHLIDYENSENFLPLIADNQTLLTKLRRTFTTILQIRNSLGDDDYILSPAIDSEGFAFDSRNQSDSSIYPNNADANGAYNIARKGLILLKKIRNGEDPVVKNSDWFNLNLSD